MQCDGGLSLPTRLVGFSLLEMQDGWFFLVSSTPFSYLWKTRNSLLQFGKAKSILYKKWLLGHNFEAVN